MAAAPWTALQVLCGLSPVCSLHPPAIMGNSGKETPVHREQSDPHYVLGALGS